MITSTCVNSSNSSKIALIREIRREFWFETYPIPAITRDYGDSYALACS